jgi:hypothetical protein
MLEEREGEHRKDDVMVKSVPGTAFEVAKAEFLLELLMGLLACPTSLDRGSERTERGPRRVIAEVKLHLAVAASLADEPSFFARKMNFVSGMVAVSDPHADCREISDQRSLRASAPRDAMKRARAERIDRFSHRLPRFRRNTMLSGTAFGLSRKF